MWKYLSSIRSDVRGPEIIMISKDEKYLYNSKKISVKPDQKYKVNTHLVGKKGEAYSAYLTVMIFDSTNKEIIRHIRWINDFSGELKDYTIVFTTPQEGNSVILGYRFNLETPFKSNLEVSLPAHSTLKLEEISNDVEDSFDDINDPSMSDMKFPALPVLDEEQENMLEKKIVWIIGSPRSGTTWLSTRLLFHPTNVIWNEPLLGFLLDIVGNWRRTTGVDRVREQYFFSPHHKDNWLPALRKLILARVHSKAQGLIKNVIIKDPSAGASIHTIMECLPNSKLIFILRDGRDVVDSILDAHRAGSWSKIWSSKPLLTEESRCEAIRMYSQMWKSYTENIWKTYKNGNPSLCHLVRYEQLKEDTLSELKKIYDFIGIRISEYDLQKIVERYDFNNIPDSQKGQGKFNRSATPGGWKKNFSKDEQEFMNSIMGETLTQMGYEISVENGGVDIGKENEKTAMNRWVVCKPNEALTWGVTITGDAFIELAQKRNIFSHDRSILELGPGYGRLLSSIISKNIPFKSYTGIDISENNIQYLQGKFKQDNIDFIQGNFSEVNLNRKYDIVLSSLTLKHQYPSFLDALRNIDRYVGTGGIYFFDLLENRNIYDGNDNFTKGPSKIVWETNGTYIAFYTQKEVLRILDSISLRIIAFDHMTHDKEHGERLVVIAMKKCD